MKVGLKEDHQHWSKDSGWCGRKCVLMELKINWPVCGNRKNEGTDVKARPVASTQGWIACLSARAQSKLLGEMVLLPQGLNGTLVRAVGTEFLPRRRHSSPDFKKAVEVQGSAPCVLFQTYHSQVHVLLQHLHKGKRQSAHSCCFLSHTLYLVPRTLNRHLISRLNSATNRPQTLALLLTALWSVKT
jgi:hypothetical protein